MSLEPDALVVRGGIQRDPEKLFAGLRTMVARDLPASLCVTAGNAGKSETYPQLLHRLCADGHIPHNQILTSTVGTLAAVGFEILDIRTGLEPYCHYEYQFPEGLLTQENLGRWISCFGDPLPNPAKENR